MFSLLFIIQMTEATHQMTSNPLPPAIVEHFSSFPIPMVMNGILI
jgi:hypothetical protein